DLDLEDLQIGSIVGFKKIIEDLALIGIGIIDEETRVAASATDCADTIEGTSTPAAIQRNRAGYGGLSKDRGTSQTCGSSSRAGGKREKSSAIETRMHLYQSFLDCYFRNLTKGFDP